ncbi:CHRD domain-containing protein [Pedobacter sp.]|uniref:CHRD domain-containing protein n=1 Tax=Pedobacter sp. TaxID=1411316 RepID=UPI0031DA6B30
MPALAMLFFSGCKKDTYTSDVFVKKQWKVDLSASKVLPAISGRTDHAVAMVYLMDNMEVHYDIYFDKALENNDTPGNAKIYLGPETTSGAVFIDLKTPAFNAERETKGSVTVDAATATKLQSEKIYLQISSVQQPNGLVRGQLN